MWVVKLGGSLFAEEALRAWLRVLQAWPGRLVVVPGGGPFADAVRAAQRRWRLDDATAHLMAVQAMAQYGRMLRALAPGLGEGDVAALRAGRGGERAVWCPVADLAATGLPASWSVSSDSLALWLARTLDATGLVLVKACPVRGAAITAERLARDGVIDGAFAGLLGGWRGRCLVAGPQMHEALPALAADDRAPWPGATVVAPAG